MLKVACALMACAMTIAAPAAAQTALMVGSPAGSVLRAGTTIPLRTKTMLTTEGKKLRVGQRFDVETAEPVMLNGQTVIPAGSNGVGEVTHVRNKGMWGKSGGIEARVIYIRVGDRQIRVGGTVSDKGVTGTAGVIGAAVLIPVAGFFLTGTSAVIPAGAPISGSLDEDVQVLVASGAPAVTASPATATTSPVIQAAVPAE